MALFRFYGRILPPAPIVKLTLKNIPRIHWEDKELGLVLDVTMSFVDSEVIISCESNRYSSAEDFSEVYKRVFDMARAAIDCCAYLEGSGLGIVLERVIPPTGVQQNILVQRADLAKLAAGSEATQDKGSRFDELYEVTVSNPSILLALNDLIASIAISHTAGINCGRVVETIREVMTPEGEDRKKGWVYMRQKLNIDTAYLKFITDVSTAPRHGKRVGAISRHDYDETINRAWTVMTRFFEYKKRGDGPLPIDEFPVLSHAHFARRQPAPEDIEE